MSAERRGPGKDRDANLLVVCLCVVLIAAVAFVASRWPLVSGEADSERHGTAMNDGRSAARGERPAPGALPAAAADPSPVDARPARLAGAAPSAATPTPRDVMVAVTAERGGATEPARGVTVLAPHARVTFVVRDATTGEAVPEATISWRKSDHSGPDRPIGAQHPIRGRVTEFVLDEGRYQATVSAPSHARAARAFLTPARRATPSRTRPARNAPRCRRRAVP